MSAAVSTRLLVRRGRSRSVESARYPLKGHVMSSVPNSASRPSNRGRWARSIAVAGLAVSLAAGAVACGQPACQRSGQRGSRSARRYRYR